ncbi:MAG TPA: class I SAM-dependent methyltransferase [Actinomycetales bacterium]|nr:class I SAM-dependent methyltransferase [Actinomycetales bacterium]
MTTMVVSPPTLQDQAPVLLGHAAGYVCARTIAMGLRHGLVAALADAGELGLSADALAERLDLDPFYVGVWCQAGLAAGVLDRTDDGFRAAPHMATLLLDTGSPAFVGGLFRVFEQPEMFQRFDDELASGERLWWDRCSHDWIASVCGTGTPFYLRLVPGGLAAVPDVDEQLRGGGRVLDMACGAGSGLQRLAETYPAATVVGVDGDQHSLDLAARRLQDAGLAGRVTLVHSTVEDLQVDEPVDVVVNNISMHECRDIDRATERVYEALAPGGTFVVSDFPFPDTDDGLRTVPGRIMAGIQFFEAQIDDQLVPRSRYDDLLARHGFVDVASCTLTPVHALTWGTRGRGTPHS